MAARLAAMAHADSISRTLLSLVVMDVLSGRPLPHDRAVIAEMLQELGIKPADPWIVKGRVTKRFPAVYASLMERSSVEVSAAARAAFERITNEKLPTLTWE
jgi:hypothetical protein